MLPLSLPSPWVYDFGIVRETTRFACAFDLVEITSGDGAQVTVRRSGYGYPYYLASGYLKCLNTSHYNGTTQLI
jgi:hypothetical protein